jgi:perosamine synthetase
MPVHRKEVRLPVAEAIAARGISLPSFPGLTDAEQDHVAEALAEA